MLYHYTWTLAWNSEVRQSERQKSLWLLRRRIGMVTKEASNTTQGYGERKNVRDIVKEMSKEQGKG